MPQISAGTDVIQGLVSLRRLPLGKIKIQKRRVIIGAGVTLAELGARAELAFLAPALDAIGSPTIRNMATIGGNLFAPAPYGDLAVCLIALGASAKVAGAKGVREMQVEEIIRKDIKAGEIVTTISFDPPEPGSFRFAKAARRALNSGAATSARWRITVSALTCRSSPRRCKARPRSRRRTATSLLFSSMPVCWKTARTLASPAGATV